MNIAVFDIQHFEMVHVLHHVFEDSTNTVSFFINKSIHLKIKNSSLGNNSYLSIIKEEFESTEAFLNACSNHIKKEKIDAIIFNTIDEDYKEVWRFIKKINIPILLTIHNVNTWLNPPFTFNRHALKNYYYRNKIISKTKAIIVQEELFIDYIKKNKLYSKPIASLPHTLNEKEIKRPSNSHLRVAIPGAIDGNNRRDYNFCLSAIKKIHQQNPLITFVFIGQALHEGEQILKNIKTLQAIGHNILHRFDKNSNSLFDQEIEQCDIVFMPVNIETKYEGIPETYGKTKVTGVLYDMMRFQKPGIIPNKHIVPPTMQSSIVVYKDEDDFIYQILELDNNKSKLTSLSNDAKKNSIHYTREKIKQRFFDWFNKLTP